MLLRGIDDKSVEGREIMGGRTPENLTKSNDPLVTVYNVEDERKALESGFSYGMSGSIPTWVWIVGGVILISTLGLVRVK